ncbi:Arc family DNA-binding protein [Mixta mediterraneensis]|uniref:Arc family DNA-binding protein n=1 Tax=Mixta mediterraneensis TaxID=2758443 RepID=UPI0018766915|nr:Arc family DNA-binding protein [Mixta mediterraneensis]MBE5250981.1 Arc family DNA-binding protein [Mixta mediterraneensis]
MSKRDDPQLRVRIPAELKSELEEKARLNKRTLTAEIVDRLEATLIQDNHLGNTSTGYYVMVDVHEAEVMAREELEEKYEREFGLAWADANKDELRDAVEKLHNVLSKRK